MNTSHPVMKNRHHHHHLHGHRIVFTYILSRSPMIIYILTLTMMMMMMMISWYDSSSMMVMSMSTQSSSSKFSSSLSPLSNSPDRFEMSRRDTLQTTTKVGVTHTLAILLAYSRPTRTHAAPPITSEELQSLSKRIERTFLRKKPPTFLLRPTLNRDFAIVCMRNSYQAMDELNCIAMDQFQRDFFLIRQAEYEPYIQTLDGLISLPQQGDLTNPYYFDISDVRGRLLAHFRRFRDNFCPLLQIMSV